MRAPLQLRFFSEGNVSGNNSFIDNLLNISQRWSQALYPKVT